MEKNMKVSFEGIGEVVMTFANNETAPAAAGDCVAMAANGEVKAAASGAVFCGVCVGADSGFAAVQTGGVVTCAYSGSTAPAVGYGKLASGSDGTVAVNTSGREYVILAVDTTGKTVTFVL